VPKLKAIWQTHANVRWLTKEFECVEKALVPINKALKNKRWLSVSNSNVLNNKLWLSVCKHKEELQ
jgi:hypothetical protein